MTTTDEWDERADTVVDAIEEPEFPDRSFDVHDYGAVADGETDDSDAVAAAIAACTAAGGGRVHLPDGEYYHAGPIHLEDDVNLHLADGATVRFSTDPEDYLPVVLSRWSGMELMNHSPMVYAFEKENVAVTGGGTLDAQAGPEDWWHWFEAEREDDPDFHKLGELMEDGVPPTERVFGSGTALRPPFVQPYRCERVLIEDVTLKNTPYWFVNPVLCEDVVARDVTMDSPDGPNNDGFNPESCERVLAEGCRFNTGDDSVTIKSGRNEDGWRIGVPCRDVVVQDCHFDAGYGGIVIGSEVSGGSENVYARRNVLDSPNQWRAIRIKTNSRRGGRVEGCYFWDNEIRQVARDHFKINLDYRWTEVGDHRGDHPPEVRDVHVADVSSGSTAQIFDVDGLSESAAVDVTVADSSFPNAPVGHWNAHVEGLELRNVTVGDTGDPAAGDLIRLTGPTYDRVGDVSFENVTGGDGEPLSVSDVYLDVTEAREGARYFVDRDDEITDLPAALSNGDLVVGASYDDKAATAESETYITFEAVRPVTVYAAFDHRNEDDPWPDWLDDWTRTGKRVRVTDDRIEEGYVVFRADFDAGTVELGPNDGFTRTSYFAVVTEQ